jgi:hypothetical protein
MTAAMNCEHIAADTRIATTQIITITQWQVELEPDPTSTEDISMAMGSCGTTAQLSILTKTSHDVGPDDICTKATGTLSEFICK